MVVGIGIALAIATSIYAAILNIRQVREWYTPDRTWVTVVIGDGLILAALACAIPWDMWKVAFAYTCIAGAPIIIWQQIRAYQRKRRAAQALERE